MTAAVNYRLARLARLHGIVFRLTLALAVTGFQPACIAQPAAAAAARQGTALPSIYREGKAPPQAPGCTYAVKHMQLENMQDHHYVT